jgi:phospholipase C
VPAAALPADTDPLAKVGHIVVIFEGNRSFYNLFDKFPGANGIANANEAAIQIDRDGKPCETLPSAINTNLKPPEIDKRFPAQLPNRPFEINSFVSLKDDTGDLTNGFYQEQLQINGGAMNRYAEVSNTSVSRRSRIRERMPLGCRTQPPSAVRIRPGEPDRCSA